MILERNGLILVARIFVIIFYEAIQREIDLNLLKEIELIFLGIRSKKVELVSPPIFCLYFDQFSIQHKSNLIMSQHARYKWIVNPYGPGFLFGSKLHISLLTSSFVMYLERETLSSNVTSSRMDWINRS